LAGFGIVFFRFVNACLGLVNGGWEGINVFWGRVNGFTRSVIVFLRGVNVLTGFQKCSL
jgi:hypothetical protein